MKTFDATTLINLFRAGDDANAPVLFTETGYYDAERAHRDDLDTALDVRGGYVDTSFNKLHHRPGAPVEVEVSVWVGTRWRSQRRQVHVALFPGDATLDEMIEAVEPHIATAQAMLRGEQELPPAFAPTMDEAGGIVAIMAGLAPSVADVSASKGTFPTRQEAQRLERSGLHPTDLNYDDPDAAEWGF